jgi:ApeA N-terminal domain 1
MPIPGQPDALGSAQRLAATWCLVGDHLPNPDTKFFGVRADVTNLAEWASMPVISTTFYPDNQYKRSWHVDVSGQSLDAELSDAGGYLTLCPSATTSWPTIRGFSVTTSSQFEVELIHGWTLGEALERAVLPLADLMVILTGTTCAVRSFDLWAGEWCSVHGHRIDPDGPTTAGDFLLTREQVGLDFLARWLDLHYRTTPVPQILAAIIRNEFPTVEAEALSLATAVEALHRTLFPNVRRFSEDEIEASLTALDASEIPGGVADTLASALRQYWHEYSYPKRVRALAEPVADAVPACIGRLGRWKNEVVEQRIALAHGIGHGRLAADQVLRMSTLNRSLLWMLTLRLLLEAGVDPSVLAGATAGSERFESDCGHWTLHWPDVFAPQ